MRFTRFFLLLLLSSQAYSATNSGKSDEKSREAADFTVGKPSQKVTPREVKAVVRPSDGATSIVTGQSRTSNNKIVGPHSHSVIKGGKPVYSRTAGGTVIGPPPHSIGGTGVGPAAVSPGGVPAGRSGGGVGKETQVLKDVN